MKSTQRWEFFMWVNFNLGKSQKWKNYKMVKYQFGNFTMGVNNKKVNRYGEFVTERFEL